MELYLEGPEIQYGRKDGAGGKHTVVDIESAQSLTGVKTLASPVLTTPTITTPTLTTPLGVVVALETLFTQVAGNKTHTATFTIPAGATILDVIVTNVVLWNSETSATLNAGLVDPDCFFSTLDLADLAAGQSTNFAWPLDSGGASIPEIDGGMGNQQLGATNGFLYNASAVSLAVVITDTNVTGTNGRTRVTVVYSLPSSVIAPTVVAF